MIDRRDFMALMGASFAALQLPLRAAQAAYSKYFTVPLPSVANEGDLLLMFVAEHNKEPSPIPAGWTVEAEEFDLLSNTRSRALSKEITQPDFSVVTTEGPAMCLCVDLSGDFPAIKAVTESSPVLGEET